MGAGKEEREGKIKQGGLWNPMVGNPGRSRADTLPLLGGMVAHNAPRVPGQMNPNQIVERGTYIIITQPLVWGELGLETLVLIHFQSPAPTCHTHGFGVYA